MWSYHEHIPKKLRCGLARLQLCLFLSGSLNISLWFCFLMAMLSGLCDLGPWPQFPHLAEEFGLCSFWRLSSYRILKIIVQIPKKAHILGSQVMYKEEKRSRCHSCQPLFLLKIFCPSVDNHIAFITDLLRDWNLVIPTTQNKWSWCNLIEVLIATTAIILQ